MSKKILVTGGAGFIGSHLVDALIKKGHDVAVLDNLSINNNEKPAYLNSDARLIQGDIRDRKLLEQILPEFQVVFHEAASVGIAQSNYEISRFVDNNALGTAILLQAIAEKNPRLEKFILSSSNTAYGEGLYKCENCGIFHPKIRSEEDVKLLGFELVCPDCEKPAIPIPTPEKTEMLCNSIYSITKREQEELSMHVGKTYGFPVAILRYFNVYGPRQALSNPYTGVSAIFMNRVKNNNPPMIYEDGLQTRDFIFIDDVVEANILAMENPNANYEIFNVGSGVPLTIKSLAEKIYKLCGKEPRVNITQEYRKGDIRHCIADTSKIREKLGWQPKFSFESGLKQLFEWSLSEKSEDNFDKADKELREKGLLS